MCSSSSSSSSSRNVDYGYLLRSCSRVKALDEGLRLHEILRKSGRDRETFIGNLLIQMYGSCGKLEDAYDVFLRIEAPNVFSWNIIISAYTQMGHLHQAMRLFSQMPQQSVVSLNAIITGYARNGHLEEARCMFDKMQSKSVVSWNGMIAAYVRNGNLLDAKKLLDEMPGKNVCSWNIMVTAYAQNGYLEESRNIFNEMTDRDVVSWTAIIAAYSQANQSREAIKLFQLMDSEGVEPNKVTFMSVLDACNSIETLETGRIIHYDAIACGFEADVGISNALLNLYGKFGEVITAKNLFDRMLQRDVVSWTTMKSAFALSNRLEEAKSLFLKIPERDVISWTCIVAGCAQNGELQEAREIFDRMPERNVVSWNAIMTGYAQCGEAKESLQLFRVMDFEGMVPDKISYGIVLDVCAVSGALAVGKLIHDDILENGLSKDSALLVGLINMYGKCGSLNAAKEIFDVWTPREKNIVPWNAMITIYASNGNRETVYVIFQLMLQDGVSPNEITSVSVLSACSHAGCLYDGWYYFRCFVGDFEMLPTLDDYICIIDLLSRTGELKDAEDLILNMPYEADGLMWMALLSCCKMQGDFDRGARAAEQVFDMDMNYSAPYVLLSSVYSTANAEKC